MKAAAWLLDHAPARLARFFDHRSRGSALLRPIVNALLPRGPTVVNVRSGAARGLRMQIDPQREKFYWSGTHERSVQAVLEDIVQPGFTVWDVGAHIGFHAIALARSVGPGGCVVAFEPVPVNRTQLSGNIQLNGFENVIIVPEALSSQASPEAEMFSRGLSVMWTLRRDAPLATDESIRVRTTTLDNAADRFPLPDLLKVDVEGAELDVLKGGLEMLARAHPIILLELEDTASFERILDLLPYDPPELISGNHYLFRPANRVR